MKKDIKQDLFEHLTRYANIEGDDGTMILRIDTNCLKRDIDKFPFGKYLKEVK